MRVLKNVLKHLTHAEAYWIYYDERAQSLLRKPRLTRRDLVYVSGRDYRVWTDAMYNDMISSYVDMLQLSSRVSILEVGCAGGLIGMGLSPKVRAYIGVDPAPNSLRIGRRLELPNARFLRGTGDALPVPNASVDRVLCADVFVNIGNLDMCHKLVAEMARVTVVGGKILVATMNDGSISKEAFNKRIVEYTASLPPYEEDPDMVERRWMPWRHKLLYRIRRQVAGAVPPQPAIITHDPQFFVATGKKLNMSCEILPVHRLHPYRGFRFNALFTKLA